jgi:arylsulfatase A-like enzyme
MLCFVYMTREIKNILLHAVDQWRGDTLGAMRHPIVHTPNIDAFAADSTTFSHHYCQALPCGPSRACMYTGLYRHNHRVGSNGTPLPTNLRNVAQHRQDAEFRPALFGYTDTPLDPAEQPDALHDTSVEDWICPGFTAVAPFLFADGFSGWTAELAAKGYILPEYARHL